MTSKKSQTILERKERQTRETSPVSKVVDADSLINDVPSTPHSTNKELLVVSEDNLDSYENCTFSVIVPFTLKQFTGPNKNCSMLKFP